MTKKREVVCNEDKEKFKDIMGVGERDDALLSLWCI